MIIGTSLLWKRIKLRESPKALVTKDRKETLNLAWLMTQGKVKSLEMKETEMGDRGSKSYKFLYVKEQRVDGSSVIDKDLFIIVRCTLVAGKAGFKEKNSVTLN